ncbi:MAG TPA: RNA polymerase factor sigma-54 [Gammaproteobacteria bacterium]|nr:RNA polymerase factor sigma-54 [Gammaproteobacteria bacterium]
MKQSIQLRLGQHLTMTPQLQQAIRLLQLSTVELQLEVQGVLDSNLMLEPDDVEVPTSAESSAEAGQEARNQAEIESNGETAANSPEAEVSSTAETIPEDLPVDTSWEDTYDMGATSFSAPADSDGRDFFETHGGSGESLHEHLTWQLDLTRFSDIDRTIAQTIVDSINDDGYLNATLEELLEGLRLDPESEIGIEEIEAVLHRIQHFDPVGVGARDPAECLIIQLQAMDPDTPYHAQALQLVQEHVTLLGNRDYNQLMRRMKLSETELQNVLKLIQSLNPRPGSQITSATPQYVVPDVFVFKNKSKWQVDLNIEAAPRLRINSHYASLVKRADNSEDNTYLRNHLQEARWFLKSLKSRHETLLKVARCIVDRQRNFFEYGEEAMKPLVLRDIAEAVEMHESTISRVTTQKYMHTPRGIYEFKYFFSSHVGTEDGGECSATAIRAIVKKLISAEKPTKPLSDSKIAALLSEQGINVARRTIAKYRESMAIPPSNERKRLA